MIRFLSILLLLYALPFIHTQQASDYETVKPFYELNVELAQSETKLYHIDLADRHADFDVALLALAYRGTAPQVFAAKTAEQLASPDQAPYSTKDMTGEVVYIRQEDLNNEQSIYVKLVCEASECHSHITFEYAKEIKTQTNGMKIYQNSENLKGTTLGVVRVEVPAGPDVDRIVIHAEAIPIKGEVNDFKFDVMIEQGEKIPHTSRYANIQRSSWFEGKTIVIPKDHPLFCTACSYTLNLKISEHMAITVMASAYGPNTNLTAHPILDGVQKEKYNSYVYNIRDPEDEFLIDVNLQQGNITLRIDCGLNVPNDFNKYFWRYEVLPNEEIVLTPKEHARCLNTPYYIVAYGNEDSVYSMRAMWRASATLDLKTGAKTVGDIFPGETISYDLLLPIFVADKFMFDIKKELPLDIMVTNCKFPSDCPGLIPAQLEATPTANLERNDTEFSFDLVDLSTQSHENKRVIIDPHGHGCYPILVKDKRFMNTPIPVCAYQLTLHSTQQTPVEYTLEVGNMGHEWLYPGMPKLDMVGKDNFKYYMLYVPHQDLKKVVIQFTKFSGDIDVYVSKTQQFPNQDTDDTEFSHEGMIAYTQAPLNGTYYIAVKGEQTSSYSLSTFVTGGDGQMEDYALTIQESVPQKGVILPNHEHPVQYYKFTLDQEEGWEGSLRITLNPHRGSLVMVVNSNDIIPLPTFSNWNTTKHDLEISSTDPNFKRNGTYHIGLYMDWGNQEALGWDDIPFTIVYYLQEKGKEDGGQVSNKNHLLLTSSMPFYGKIKHGEIKYFEVEVNPWDKSVTIYKQSDVGGVDLYLSRDPDQLYPGPQDYTYTTAISHTNKLELNHYDVRAICQDSVVLLVCPFFMAVVPSSDLDETSFSLHISRETTAIDSMTPLEDGKRLISEVPERSDRTPSLYYFYPHTREYSVVTVACPGKHITIYASTKNVEIGSSFSPDIEPPTPDSYAYSSKNNNVDTVGIAHLTIPPQDELNATVVAIAVYFQSFSNISSQYSIVVSAHSTRIYTGQPYHSSVQNDSYVYFSFDVSKDNCNLLVAITTLDDGNPDLLVSYGDNLRPTIGDAQFSSISDQRTEVIEVSNLDILPLKSMAGTWTIGVYGRTASSFTLTVIYEDQKMVELKSGIPFEMLLSENSKMFFKYYHEENNDVEIRLERFSGDVVAYVLNIGENEHYQANLPNSSYNDWTIDPGFQPNLKVNTSDPEACTNCLYLIGLETRASSKFIISVNEDVKYVKLQNGIHTRQELEPNSSRWYVFSSPNADEVYLNVYLFGSELRVYSSHNPTVNNSNYELRNVVTIGTPSYQVAIGNEEFKNDTIWDGEQEVPSRKNAFYFLFENPGTSPIKYNVIARTHETNIILRPGDRAETYISGKNQTSWVFYSSHDNELIKLILDYHVAQTGNEGQVREVAMEGLPVEANYWAEKETQGSGRVAELERDKVVEDQNIRFGMGGGGFSFREVITTTSKKGKYIFDISNPFDENIVLGVRLLRSEIGTLTLDQNSVHSSSLEKGHSETIEIFLGHKGSWYLWVFTCAGEIQVSVQDSSKELELESSIMTLPQGQEHLFRAHHPRGGVKTVTITRSPSADDDTQFYLSSSYFFEGKVYDFEPVNDDYKSSISYANNVVEVSLTTVQFEELEATDRIIYSVKLCPYDEANKEHEWNICGSANYCQVDSHDFMINVQPQNLTARFENVAYGNYYVKTVANLYHMQKLIKFVPYAIKTLEAGPKAFLEEEVSKTDSESRATYVLIGLIVLLVIGGLGYLAYGKVKSPKSNARGEMQMQNFPAQKKQQYEAVGEEEVTIAEPGEQSEEKSEDKSEEK